MKIVRGRGMRIVIGSTLFLCTLCLFTAGLPSITLGVERYPSRAVDIVVPFAAGAATDYLARFIAEELSKKWAVPVNVINKPGGNTVIGTAFVMNAAPDGYTLLMDSPPSSSAQMGLKGIPYKVSDRTFLTLTMTVPQVFIVYKDCPWNTMKEFAEGARKDPAVVVWGAAAGGRGVCDIAMLQFFEAAGINIPKTRRVDFPGSAPAINALAGGHILLTAASPGAVMPVINAGKAKALGLTVTKRSTQLPQVPTTEEAGYPTVDYTSWKGFSGPPGLPAHVKETIIRTVEEILKDREVIEKLDKKFEGVPIFRDSEGFRKFVNEDAKKIEKLVGLMLSK